MRGQSWLISHAGFSADSQPQFPVLSSLRGYFYSDFLPVALLARGTQRDLDEVYRLATRCGMRLHLTDYHLAQARFLLAQQRISEAREHVEKAAVLISETGYHRRDRELADLRQALTAATPQP